MASATPRSEDLISRAAQHFRAGRSSEAIALCHERLAEAPGDREASRVLAKVLGHLGHRAVAVLLLERAVAADPEDAALLTDLGSALAEAGSAAHAAAAYERALLAEPANADAYFGLLDLGERSRLEGALRTAGEERPDDPSPHFWLATLLADAGDEPAARAAFEVARRRDPSCARRHLTIGSRLSMLGDLDRAERMYRWGLALLPGDPQLRHMLQATRGEASERATDAYVTDYFDAFAETFEETLVARLDYRGPELIRDALEQWLPQSGEKSLTVLDAGCGTGLCGRVLRRYAARLVGVDLSAQMLERAKATGCYDSLRRDELVAALVAERGSYDLIVAADVLIYFGELGDLLAAAAGALRLDGLLAVTLERHDGGAPLLQPSGRYAHSECYLRETADSAGLEVLELRRCELRTEAGTPVPGLVAIARPAAAA